MIHLQTDIYDVDDPRDFETLEVLEKAILLTWIAYAVQPHTNYGTYSSYGYKHMFADVGFYVTNGQFKGAMLAAGYEPKDRDAQNWVFLAKKPSLDGRGVGVLDAMVVQHKRLNRESHIERDYIRSRA